MTTEQPSTSPKNLAPDKPGDKPKMPEKPAIIQQQPPGEVDGPKGLEPTRYGDWERKGITSDF
ncbi:succinate dehydrogenase assembly factor 4 [Ferrovibrio sp.]|uniref:DUF1674 domain-containing protein n=1 Tax=Ferrovibrio sp. TaxID=1917215 RepID=UPI001B700E43|nr:succinate dehydrogenase assembly factor 4 [Ferrovibrio sp.]MBP7062635.1 DUF1674 domain-containing protein [Ferrovibrio sp.]